MEHPHFSHLLSLYEIHFVFKHYYRYHFISLVPEPGSEFLRDNAQEEEKLLAIPYLNLQTAIFMFRKCSCATVLPAPIAEWNLSPVRSRDPYFHVLLLLLRSFQLKSFYDSASRKCCTTKRLQHFLSIPNLIMIFTTKIGI